MNVTEFLNNLTVEYGTAEFEYKNKKCGIEPITENSITTYCMWYGDDSRNYKDIKTLLSDKFFDGKTILEIFPEIDVYF